MRLLKTVTEVKTVKINIKNYQSISEAELDLKVGINLIIGASNSGKTAILRAVNSLLTNPSAAKRHIKNKTDSCEITLTGVTNVPSVTWQRTKKGSTKYIVDNEEYTKTGNTNLFELMNYNANFIYDEKGVINIQGEWDKPFPFSRTESELFKLLENIFSISDSCKVLKLIKNDDDQLSKQIKELGEDINSYENKITLINDYLDTNPEAFYRMLEENLDKNVSAINDAEKDVTLLTTSLKQAQRFSSLDSINFQEPISYLQVVKEVCALDQMCPYFNLNCDSLDIDKICIMMYNNTNDDINKLEKTSTYFNLEINDINVDIDANGMLSVLELDKDILSIEKNIGISNELLGVIKSLTTELQLADDELNSIEVCPLCGK